MPAPAVVTALEEVADGLARRLRDAALAERQLARFAFTEGPPGEGGGGWNDGAELSRDEAALDALARDVTLRALAAAVDSYPMLARLGAEPVAVDALARALGVPALALTERAGALAQLGLAARDLERGALAATPAGRGVVVFVDALTSAVAARCRKHFGERS
jgi:hypothetical protein